MSYLGRTIGCPTCKEDEPVSILETAQDLIHGDRNVAYGHPRDNFQVIADLWSAYLYHRPQADEPLAPIDVANLMILLKTARVVGGTYHQDSYTDIAGYAGTAERLQEVPEEYVDLGHTTHDPDPRPRTWSSLVDVPRGVTVTDKEGDTWKRYATGAKMARGDGGWHDMMMNQDLIANNRYAPFTEAVE
jgi:hypothetical protein